MSLKNKKVKQEVRTTKYAEAFIKTGGNATRAYKAINPAVSLRTANEEGTKCLKKPEYQNKIIELLPKEQEEADVIIKAFRTKSPNIIKWSEKHQYLETSLKLKGLLKDKDSGSNTNIAIVYSPRLNDVEK